MLVYIPVIAHFDAFGNITPSIFWWNGKPYTIDRVLDIKREVSSANIGIKYTCKILGKERNLYYDYFKSRWYVDCIK